MHAPANSVEVFIQEMSLQASRSGVDPAPLTDRSATQMHYNEGADLLTYLVDPSVFDIKDGYVDALTGPSISSSLNSPARVCLTGFGTRHRAGTWHRGQRGPRARDGRETRGREAVAERSLYWARRRAAGVVSAIMNEAGRCREETAAQCRTPHETDVSVWLADEFQTWVVIL